MNDWQIYMDAPTPRNVSDEEALLWLQILPPEAISYLRDLDTYTFSNDETSSSNN